MANVALKTAEMQRLSVVFTPKGDFNLISTVSHTHTQEKTRVYVQMKAVTVGLPFSVSQNEGCI